MTDVGLTLSVERKKGVFVGHLNLVKSGGVTECVLFRMAVSGSIWANWAYSGESETTELCFAGVRGGAQRKTRGIVGRLWLV